MLRAASWIVILLTCFAEPAAASIIKKPPEKAKDLTYSELPCTEQDKAHIYEIISTVAENNKVSLFFLETNLKEKGAQINHVHPLKFLSTIFSHSYLKGCMRPICEDRFKYKGFMDGLASSLSREAEKGKLMVYLHEFATEIDVSPDPLRVYLEGRDWDGLVYFLTYN